jgi:transposase
VQEVISGCGHEVLVANPRLMDGSKRRKRKNDRIDGKKLARLGRVDPESLYPIQHRSREVRQDLVMLRARDALVAVRTEIINTTRGLVKSLGTRLPKCSSQSFARRRRSPVPQFLPSPLLKPCERAGHVGHVQYRSQTFGFHNRSRITLGGARFGLLEVTRRFLI